MEAIERVAAAGAELTTTGERTETEVPAPLWGAEGIGYAVVEDGVVRRANAALVALLGQALDARPAAELVTPGQAAAFSAWIAAAPGEWTRGCSRSTWTGPRSRWTTRSGLAG